MWNSLEKFEAESAELSLAMFNQQFIQLPHLKRVGLPRSIKENETQEFIDRMLQGFAEKKILVEFNSLVGFDSCNSLL